MATIVQDYGPIYGEVVNGTVQGRPNGSVYVPISNTITMSTRSLGFRYIGGAYRVLVTDLMHVSAQAQDLGSYIQRQVFTDADCTDLIGSNNYPAGQFNVAIDYFIYSATVPDVGSTYYFRTQLMSSTGVAVATSEVIPLECVA